MRSGKELVGKPVYSVDEGRQIGKVRDLYVDSSLNRIVGIHLGTEGLLRRKSLLVPGEDVVVLGVDAVLVQRSGSATDDSSHVPAKSWLRREKLDGRQVDTPGGTKLGTIGDIVVDQAGNITGFVLGRVFVEGPLGDKRTIDRSVVLDLGQEDGVMTIDLPTLEAMLLGGTAVAVGAEPTGTAEAVDTMVVEINETTSEAAAAGESATEEVIEGVGTNI
jgi:uncharacterized protein YrrD